MRSRSGVPPQTRDAASRIHQLLDQGGVIRGSLVEMRNTCGNKNCRCARGELHSSLYIRQTSNGKPRMMLIPRPMHSEAAQMVERWREIRKLLDVLSDHEWERIKEVKKKR